MNKLFSFLANPQNWSAFAVTGLCLSTNRPTRTCAETCARTHTYAPKHTHACAHTHKQLKQLAELLMSNNKVANIKWCMPPTTFLSCPGKINVDGQYLQNDFVTQVKLWAWEEIPMHTELHGNGSSSQDHSSWQRVWGKTANRKDYLQDIKHLRSQGTGQRLQGLRFKPGWGSNTPPPPSQPPF